MVSRITLSESALHTIIRAAIQGYEARYKEERLGILLGAVVRGNARVKEAVLYRGGTRTRSAADIDSGRFKRRVEELERSRRLAFLGSFHTHNEISGTITTAMSAADKAPLCDERPPLVEVIAAIWASGGRVQPSQRFFQGEQDGYRYRIAGYACEQRFKGAPVYAVGATRSGFSSTIAWPWLKGRAG